MVRKAFGALVAALLLAGPAVPVGAAVLPGGQQTLGGWRVSSSADAGSDGARVSAPGYDTGRWLRAGVDETGAPGTEIGALLANGQCASVYFSDRMRQCFGEMTTRGPVTVPRFAVPWWFRSEFTARPGAGQLVLSGIIGSADVWLNGRQVADHATVTGAYAERTLSVPVRPGRNALAILMHPNDPTKTLTLSNLDWSQIPPDNDTGINAPVVLRTPGTVDLSDAHVRQHDGALTVVGEVTNNGDESLPVRARARITSPSGAVVADVAKSVLVPAHASRAVTFTPGEFPALRIAHPQLWWPYQLGGQPLYGARLSVTGGAAKSWQFGIRMVTTRLVGKSAATPEGSRQYLVNGKPVLIRGGGYSDDILQRYFTADVAKQIQLIRGLGLNAIRLEGHDQPDDFYQQMDRAGILVLGGFACCDGWELPSDGSGVTENDYQTMYLSARYLGTLLRNHPSVVSYQWSDNQPIPRQESETLRGFADADFDVPVLASAEYKSTPTLGPAGEKEGPYGWAPPEYWYDNGHFDPGTPDRTNMGGAWGFDSEASAGDTVPTLDSLRRFLSPDELRKLWQEPDYNQYHTNSEKGHDKYHFGTMYWFNTAMDKRYGKPSSLESYVEQAQLANYENVRSQFEAFIAHSVNQQALSTGIIYWMLNKGWPSLLWTLYNNDGDQAGSYFGAQQANRVLHALYTYDDNTVAVANLGGAVRDGLTVRSRVYDITGKLTDDRTADLSLTSQQVRTKVLTPKVPTTGSSTYFVELEVRQHGALVDRNTYWRTTKPDVVDWQAAYGDPQPAPARYADLTQLRSLAPAKVTVHARPTGPGTVRVTLTNPARSGAPAFFVRADLGSARWDGNDITLWPGESQTITAHAANTPLLRVSGYNVAPTTVPVIG